MSNILKKLFDSSRIVEKFNLVQRCDMAGEMINTVLKAEKANEGRIAEAESRARDIISGAADQADAAAEVIIKEAREKARETADRAAKEAAAVDSGDAAYSLTADPAAFESAVAAAMAIITENNHV